MDSNSQPRAVKWLALIVGAAGVAVALAGVAGQVRSIILIGLFVVAAATGGLGWESRGVRRGLAIGACVLLTATFAVMWVWPQGNVQSIDNSRSDKTTAATSAADADEPLEWDVSVSATTPSNGFYALAPAGDHLADYSTATDCDHLWQRVVEHGAERLADPVYVIDLHNRGSQSLAITGITANVTSHKQALDGLVVGCPPYRGGMDPIKMLFDISRTDSALAEQSTPDASGRFPQVFGGGYIINLTPDERAPLSVMVWTPSTGVSWHFVVDYLLGNTHRTVTIGRSVGQDFASSGFLGEGAYHTGFLLDQAGVQSPKRWGDN